MSNSPRLKHVLRKYLSQEQKVDQEKEEIDSKSEAKWMKIFNHLVATPWKDIHKMKKTGSLVNFMKTNSTIAPPYLFSHLFLDINLNESCGMPSKIASFTFNKYIAGFHLTGLKWNPDQPKLGLCWGSSNHAVVVGVEHNNFDIDPFCKKINPNEESKDPNPNPTPDPIHPIHVLLINSGLGLNEWHNYYEDKNARKFYLVSKLIMSDNVDERDKVRWQRQIRNTLLMKPKYYSIVKTEQPQYKFPWVLELIRNEKCPDKISEVYSKLFYAFTTSDFFASTIEESFKREDSTALMISSQNITSLIPVPKHYYVLQNHRFFRNGQDLFATPQFSGSCTFWSQMWWFLYSHRLSFDEIIRNIKSHLPLLIEFVIQNQFNYPMVFSMIRVILALKWNQEEIRVPPLHTLQLIHDPLIWTEKILKTNIEYPQFDWSIKFFQYLSDFNKVTANRSQADLICMNEIIRSYLPEGSGEMEFYHIWFWLRRLWCEYRFINQRSVAYSIWFAAIQTLLVYTVQAFKQLKIHDQIPIKEETFSSFQSKQKNHLVFQVLRIQNPLTSENVRNKIPETKDFFRKFSFLLSPDMKNQYENRVETSYSVKLSDLYPGTKNKKCHTQYTQNIIPRKMMDRDFLSYLDFPHVTFTYPDHNDESNKWIESAHHLKWFLNPWVHLNFAFHADEPDNGGLNDYTVRCACRMDLSTYTIHDMTQTHGKWDTSKFLFHSTMIQRWGLPVRNSYSDVQWINELIQRKVDDNSCSIPFSYDISEEEEDEEEEYKKQPEFQKMVHGEWIQSVGDIKYMMKDQFKQMCSTLIHVNESIWIRSIEIGRIMLHLFLINELCDINVRDEIFFKKFQSVVQPTWQSLCTENMEWLIWMYVTNTDYTHRLLDNKELNHFSNNTSITNVLYMYYQHWFLKTNQQSGDCNSVWVTVLKKRSDSPDLDAVYRKIPINSQLSINIFSKKITLPNRNNSTYFECCSIEIQNLSIQCIRYQSKLFAISYPGLIFEPANTVQCNYLLTNGKLVTGIICQGKIWTDEYLCQQDLSFLVHFLYIKFGSMIKIIHPDLFACVIESVRDGWQFTDDRSQTFTIKNPQRASGWLAGVTAHVPCMVCVDESDSRRLRFIFFPHPFVKSKGFWDGSTKAPISDEELNETKDNIGLPLLFSERIRNVRLSYIEQQINDVDSLDTLGYLFCLGVVLQQEVITRRLFDLVLTSLQYYAHTPECREPWFVN